jgi:hypothetical protein
MELFRVVVQFTLHPMNPSLMVESLIIQLLVITDHGLFPGISEVAPA